MIPSHQPYLVFAMERYLAAQNEDISRMNGTQAVAWMARLDRRWQGVQCAIFHLTRDVNHWDVCKILQPCQATMVWIERLMAEENPTIAVRSFDFHAWVGTEHCLREGIQVDDLTGQCVNDHTGCIYNDGHNGCGYPTPPPALGTYDSPLRKKMR